MVLKTKEFEDFRYRVLNCGLKTIDLDTLYSLVDRVIATEKTKVAPLRNTGYYKKYGTWIAALEGEGVLVPRQFVILWDIHKPKTTQHKDPPL